MNTNKLTIYKANEVVEAGYKISLNEQRVVLACIGQIESDKELLATDEFELSAKDFAAIFEVSEKRAYQALVEVTENLFNRYIVINNPFPNRPNITKLKTRWISSIYYNTNEGKVTLRFAQDILPYLSKLERCFTKYELKHIGKMTSIYAIRLYELLMQWKSTGKREIEIEWLKGQFELDDSYNRMDNLKRRVIDPAITEINEHSNFSVSWTQRKTGRRVTHLTFEFSEKKPVKTKVKKEKPKDKNTSDIFHGLTENQIEMFGTLLAEDAVFGSTHAKIGELMPAFTRRIKKELHDIEKQKLYLPYLIKLGLKIK